jgi:hypothetical protein
MTTEKTTKKKKSIFKRWWFWVVLVILIGAVASGGEEESEPKMTKEDKQFVEEGNKKIAEADKEIEKAEQASAEVEEPAKEEENDPGISKEEFDKIQAGMTYEEVVEIIGGEGELNSESGSKGDQYYTAMYTWNGESGFGANANATFQGNPAKLQNKSQFGLE